MNAGIRALFSWHKVVVIFSLLIPLKSHLFRIKRQVLYISKKALSHTAAAFKDILVSETTKKTIMPKFS